MSDLNMSDLNMSDLNMSDTFIDDMICGILFLLLMKMIKHIFIIIYTYVYSVHIDLM